MRKKIFYGTAFAATLLFSGISHAEEPYNSLDCSEEEVLSYSSKDNYTQPNGFSVMPSVEEFKPAQFQKDLTEKGQEEMGCPSFSMDVDWNKLVEKYNDMVDSLKDAVDALNDLLAGGGPGFDIGSIIDEAVQRVRDELNKGICERMTAQFKGVMWDVIDARFGIDESVYDEGTKTVIHELIKEQNRGSDGELLGLFEKMGAKDEGDDLIDFLADSGIESEGIRESLNDRFDDETNNIIDDEIDDVSDEFFGNGDNPFDNVQDQFEDDLEDGAGR